jgi:hypothetical protein
MVDIPQLAWTAKPGKNQSRDVIMWLCHCCFQGKMDSQAVSSAKNEFR